MILSIYIYIYIYIYTYKYFIYIYKYVYIYIYIYNSYIIYYILYIILHTLFIYTYMFSLVFLISFIMQIEEALSLLRFSPKVKLTSSVRRFPSTTNTLVSWFSFFQTKSQYFSVRGLISSFNRRCSNAN